MWHHTSRGRIAPRLAMRRADRRIVRLTPTISTLLIALGLLAACGSTSSGQTSSTATAMSLTPTLPPTSTEAAQPNPPLSPTAILDVRPASMSLVGHLDCPGSGAYTCTAEVLARSSNLGSLRWTTSTSVPGQVVFSPAGGVLAPGQTTMIKITVPLGDCTRGVFAFHGPANTHTISWSC